MDLSEEWHLSSDLKAGTELARLGILGSAFQAEGRAQALRQDCTWRLQISGWLQRLEQGEQGGEWEKVRLGA